MSLFFVTPAQVDAVLEELHVVRTAANTPAGAAAGANGHVVGLPNGGQGLVAITLSGELQGLPQLQIQRQQAGPAGVAGAVPPSPMDVDMDEAGTPDTPDHARANGGPGMEPKVRLMRVHARMDIGAFARRSAVHYTVVGSTLCCLFGCWDCASEAYLCMLCCRL